MRLCKKSLFPGPQGPFHSSLGKCEDSQMEVKSTKRER